MRAFSKLYELLDIATSTQAKIKALVSYFSNVTPEDAACAVSLLTGCKLNKLVTPVLLKDWALEFLQMPQWLYLDAFAEVGDTAETLALLMDNVASLDIAPDISLHHWLEREIIALNMLPESRQKKQVMAWWQQLGSNELYLLHKIMLGDFRAIITQNILAKALSEVAFVPHATMLLRLQDYWEPTAQKYQALMRPLDAGSELAPMYPFSPSLMIAQEVTALGQPQDWHLEWKFQGLRCQLIRRHGSTTLWSREEEILTDQFPELRDGAAGLPDGTVLDGMILPYRKGVPLPYPLLEQRLKRKTPNKTTLDEASVIFMAFDLLEENHRDIRTLSLVERRRRLTLALWPCMGPLRLSEGHTMDSWDAAYQLWATARDQRADGLILKRTDSPYADRESTTGWRTWKVEPYTLDAVLLYAQPGNGPHATLYSEYTFAVHHRDELVPIAKVQQGLSKEEVEALDQWIRKHTVERFGPVRSVEPFHVFQLAFEGITASSRHKSGVSLRLPRIMHWQTQKTVAEADTVETLRTLLHQTS